jgi:shikimate dehydrogenase
MKRACVIGWPIEHSRSPLIHSYWLTKYGIDGSYEKIAVRTEDAAQFLRALAGKGLSGCNVTVPLKEIAFATADLKDPSAGAAGAANTIWLDDGKIACANTDTYGFMRHLEVSAPHWRKRDRPVVILGAGGAARAIVYGFLQAGVARVIVLNRSRDRAEALAHHFGATVMVREWDERQAVCRDASVIVNTTTLGMKGQGSVGVDFAGVHHDTVAADIVYVPLETAFLRAARQAGLTGVDGLGMLLHQAVPGFEKWFGVRPEVTDELRARIVADIERA